MRESTWQPYIFTPPDLPSTPNPRILAFSCYFHDSSACLVEDGRVVAAADEERFSRKKHDAGFPEQAIRYCRDAARGKDIDFVVFYEDPAVKWERIQETLRRRPPRPETRDRIHQIWREVKSKDRIQAEFNRRTGLPHPVVFLDHHVSHAASSFFVSGFDRAAVVTIDGVGEKVTTSFGRGAGGKLDMERCINFPNSIGLFYTALTVFLGFRANDHEYKVMGLAPYGVMDRNRNPYYARLRNVFTLHTDGSFALDMRYFGHDDFDSDAYTEDLADLLRLRPNTRDGAITDDYMDLAAALALATEDLVFNLLRSVREATGERRLCMAGGVALNSVINGKIISRTGFEDVFIQPSAGDSGTVIGAAKYVQHLVDPDAAREHVVHSSYGPEYSSGTIRDFLESAEIVFTEFADDEDLVAGVAELLVGKNVVGWFQGRMEWGPRALGNRSILASPLHEEMRDVLNLKVKHRELFRPFAPVVCIDDAETFFDCDLPVPEPTDYMLMVYPVKRAERSRIPAVTHVDGSGRLQTVRKSQNHLYYRLIKEFGKRTGVPVLVNTSFNVRGEPIVCTPADAYRCMMGTEIDYLVLGRFLVKRDDNLKHSWTPAFMD